jgi:uncharacterized membrane protein YbhN (UPF0104 family)
MKKIFIIFKKFLPFVVLFLFIFLISYFYLENKNEFNFLYNLNLKFILITLFLCLCYLITESLIFRNITIFFRSKINIFESFLIICTTYLCNTFIQFSGLGYRAYYLKRFKKISVTDFIVKSIYIIFVEFMVFSSLSLILLLVFDKINSEIDIYFTVYFILLTIFFFSIIMLFFHTQIIKLLTKIIFLKDLTLVKKIINIINKFDKKRFDIFLKKYLILFLFQFIILFLIFLNSYSLFEKGNSILFSIISTMSTDLSFIFTLTPYAVGVSETFIFFSSNNFDIKISEILFLTNIFRLSMFCIYFIFGMINLFIFSKKIIT